MPGKFPGVQTVQIVFNIFRHRPAELFFTEAKRRKVGIIVRVPLASGMLTGKLSRESKFEPDDHRQFNRHGEMFDQGETFSGVDYETGLEAVKQLREILPAGATLAQWALRWILMFDAVSCVIPGARRPAQVQENIAASAVPALLEPQMTAVRQIYGKLIRPRNGGRA